MELGKRGNEFRSSTDSPHTVIPTTWEKLHRGGGNSGQAVSGRRVLVWRQGVSARRLPPTPGVHPWWRRLVRLRRQHLGPETSKVLAAEAYAVQKNYTVVEEILDRPFQDVGVCFGRW